MKWLARLFATDPDTTRGKLLVLVVDKLIIGLIILGAIGTYQMFQSNRDAAREARLADARTKVERTRLAKDLLPFLLDNSSDVIARGYLLSATLSAGLIDPNVAIEVATELHDQGLPDHHIPRIASLALPAGLQAIARHGARLHKELRDNGNPNRASSSSRDLRWFWWIQVCPIVEVIRSTPSCRQGKARVGRCSKGSYTTRI